MAAHGANLLAQSRVDLSLIWGRAKEQQLRSETFTEADPAKDVVVWNQGKSCDERAFLVGLIPNGDKRYWRGHNITHNLPPSIFNHEIAQLQPGFPALGYVAPFFEISVFLLFAKAERPKPD